jgi:hypothetical protein
MLALEIRLNGELKATCGTDDIEGLVGLLRASRKGASAPKDFDFRFECQGFRPIDAATREALKWVSARVQLGDEVSMRLVETQVSQEPIDRQIIPAKGLPPDA